MTSVVGTVKHLVPFRVKAAIRHVLDFATDAEGRINQREVRAFLKKTFAAINFNGIPGDYVEFGTGRCQTFATASAANERSSRPLRKLWGFDSFAGLPPESSDRDQHRAWVPGAFAEAEASFRQLCRRYGVRNYELMPGYFNQSLPNLPDTFLPAGTIAFAYVDCDMYTSTLDVLRFLKPRLQGGMVLAFDDYFCVNRSGISGEMRAFQELYLDDRHFPFRFAPYIQYGWAGQSFIVQHA